MILCVHVFGQTKKADVEVGVICWFVLAHVLTDEMYNAGTLLVRILCGATVEPLAPCNLRERVFLWTDRSRTSTSGTIESRLPRELQRTGPVGNSARFEATL